MADKDAIEKLIKHIENSLKYKNLDRSPEFDLLADKIIGARQQYTALTRELSESRKRDIENIIKEAHENVKRHDWGNMRPLEHIALIHEEGGESSKCIRKDEWKITFRKSDRKPEGLPVELADIIIRIFGIAGLYNLPLVEAIKLKMKYNWTRPKNHGKTI